MGILVDSQIRQMISKGKLGIEPFNPLQLQPASYDLRVSSKILVSPINPEQLGRVIILSEDRPVYKVLSGQMIGVLSNERLSLPLDMCGRFGIRSYFARRGINAFGGLQLDPGFNGRLTMSLLNAGPEPVPISLNDLLFSVEFEKLEVKADKAYSGPYQNQDDFPEDQYNYILSAHTTILTEIPTLRSEIKRLSNIIEEFDSRRT
ncbi:MAG: hypothetical protein ABSF74_03765 [Dehalococcoidia bacterium]|jgi:dCTP deaminase